MYQNGEGVTLDLNKAASLFQQACDGGSTFGCDDLASVQKKDTRFEDLMEQATVLRDRGWKDGDNPALIEAIEAFRSVLVEWTREHAPLKWARAQNELGAALTTLGQREDGTDRLEMAVNAYNAALKELTRERVPELWARTKNELGITLWTLGMQGTGTERLKQAIDAHQAALEEWPRERSPILWAATQMDLGNVLETLGQRRQERADLEAALTAIKGASDVYQNEVNEAEQAQLESYFRERIEAIEASLKELDGK